MNKETKQEDEYYITIRIDESLSASAESITLPAGTYTLQEIQKRIDKIAESVTLTNFNNNGNIEV